MRVYKFKNQYIDLDHVLSISEPYPSTTDGYTSGGSVNTWWTVDVTMMFLQAPIKLFIGWHRFAPFDSEKDFRSERYAIKDKPREYFNPETKQNEFYADYDYSKPTQEYKDYIHHKFLLLKYEIWWPMVQRWGAGDDRVLKQPGDYYEYRKIIMS